DQLNREFSTLARRGSGLDSVRPLVFLNACGSGSTNPSGVASFPALFLANNHRGFIGTEVAIPDDPAAAFSGYFYTRLLDGEPVGQALYGAEWDLLDNDESLLGMVYVSYADPELALRNRGDIVVARLERAAR